MLKKCTKCGKIKDEIEFYWRSPKSQGRYARCKVCVIKQDIYRRENRKKRNLKSLRQLERKIRLKTRYGITPEQYDAMLVTQGGVCAICGRPETSVCGGKVRSLAVDHDHRTGKVRALLCGDCNTVLGRADDSPERLEKAAAYLRYHLIKS